MHRKLQVIVAGFVLIIFCCNLNASDKCNIKTVKNTYSINKSDYKKIGKYLKKDYVNKKGIKIGKKLSKSDICSLIVNKEVSIVSSDGEKNSNLMDKKVDLREIKPKILFLRFPIFSNETISWIESVISSERWEASDKIILDLRGNSGGALHHVLKIARLFGSENQTIGSFIGSYSFTYKTKDSPSILKDKKMLVLVDKHTANGAEMFVSFLKEYSIALLAGERTAGVSVVRSVTPLSDEKYVLIPNGYLFASTGSKIQDVGVLPDIEYAFQGCSDQYNVCDELIRNVFN